MRLFRRKKKTPKQTASPASDTHSASSSDTHSASSSDAKEKLKVLRADKKELSLQLKGVNAELARIRAERQIALGQRPSLPRGRGFIGTLGRISRDMEREKHAATIAPLEQRKAGLKQRILTIDRAIARVQEEIQRSK